MRRCIGGAVLFLTLAPTARADFILETEVDAFGGVASTTFLPPTGSIVVGGATIPYTRGGAQGTTAAGAVVTVLFDSTPATGLTGTSDFRIFVSVPAGDTTRETATFTDRVNLFVNVQEFTFQANYSLAIDPAGSTVLSFLPPITPGSVQSATPTVISTFTAGTPSFTSPGVNDPDGGHGSLTVTRLDRSAVPEPSSLALVGIGLATLFGLSRRSRGRRPARNSPPSPT